MYKRLGVSNTDITLYTSWLYLPWVIKPFWSPFVELVKTKRYWIVIMQLFIGAGLAGVAFTIPVSSFFQYTLAFMWLLAFSSATHDIAADGFYMMGLDQGQQSYFVGIRSTFYRFATIAGQGLLVILAGSIESGTGQDPIFLNVNAVNTQVIIAPENPFSIEHKEGFTVKNLTEISISNFENEQKDTLKEFVRKSNIANSFYTEEKQKEKKNQVYGRNM
jgi:MFS transporter, PAT family, beta-lactamase induction signal transducer AmpG